MNLFCEPGCRHFIDRNNKRICGPVASEALRCAAPDEPFGNAMFANGNLQLPVVFVTAYEAAAFCSWLGRRLPTEAQWDLVAYGTDGRKYPWGNTKAAPGQVNGRYKGNPHPRLEPADDSRYQSGQTRDRVQQMLGNAAEWTSTLTDGYTSLGTWNGHSRVRALLVMGGSYLEEVQPSGAPNDSVPSAAVPQIGFRCVTTK